MRVPFDLRRQGADERGATLDSVSTVLAALRRNRDLLLRAPLHMRFRHVASSLPLHASYLGLSVLFATRFFSLTHLGSHAMTDGDPALMAWTLQWMSHALVHDPLHLFAGNVFFPYSHAVTLSDPMLPLAVVNIPVRFITANPWVGYNLLILAAYYLSCVSGAALVRAITGSSAAAAWGGIFWGFLFFRVQHIGHLQILSFQGIPAAVVCLLRLWRSPSTRGAVVLAVTIVAQALVSWYLAVILGVVLLVVTLGQSREAVARPHLRAYLAAVVLISVAIVPFAWAYRAGFEDSSLRERLSLVDIPHDGVQLRDYLTPPVATVFGGFVRGNAYTIWGENTLYVGWIALLLGSIGTWNGLRATTGSTKRWTAIGLALVGSGYVLALGFVSERLGLRLPLHYLARLVPPLAGMRATQRFSLVLYVGILILSGLGVARLARVVNPHVRAAVVVVLSSAFLVEVFPVRLPISAAHAYQVSWPDRVVAQYQRGRAQPLVVLHLPIYYFSEAYPVSEAAYMVDSTWHWARIVNGFSGGVPNGFMERMGILNRLPDARAVDLLLDLGVDVLAVHGDAAHPGNQIFDFFTHCEWASVMRSSNGEFVVMIDQRRAPPGHRVAGLPR